MPARVTVRFFGTSNLREQVQHRWMSVATAVAAVGVSSMARAVIFHFVGTSLPFMLFFPAVIAAALYAGMFGGLLSTLLSALAAVFWMEPVGSFHLANPADTTAVVFFVAISALMVKLCVASQRSYRAAESAYIQQAKLAAIIASSDDAIISQTLDGTVQSWNGAAERFFGYTEAEMIGESIFRLIPADQVNAEKAGLARLSRGEQIDHYKTVRLRKDGTLIDVAISLSPVRDSRGRIVGASKTARDISDQRRNEATVRAAQSMADSSLAQLQAVVENISEGLVVSDPQGRALHWNNAALKLHGFATVDEVTRPLVDFPKLFELRTLDGQLLDIDDWPMARALRGESLSDYELQVRRTDTQREWVIAYSAASVRDAQGNIMLALVTLRDVTDRRRATQERERLFASEQAARALAEQASRMKDDFLATLSHELRTPLNAILGWSQLLRSNPGDSDDLAVGLETIERNARAQTQIISDLLDMSRIISGKLRLDVQRLDLTDIIKVALETSRPAADAKGVRVNSVLDPSAAWVSGDPNRLQQVLWNLLSNAIKFTPRDGQVQVVLQRAGSDAQISVIDTGEGIEAAFIPHVFDRFRQADSSITRNHGGLGLGLSIVRQLVELHGGTVRARSGGVGSGATFTVSLPLSALQTKTTTASAAGKSRGGSTSPFLELQGVKVLVVDDEPDNRLLVQRTLEERGAVVSTAGAAADALRMIRAEKPDVLVSDIGMPGGDGYSLMRQIRMLSGIEGGDLPAVALTAYARSEDRLHAIKAGFQIHLGKPIEPAELISVVALLAGQSATIGQD